jgi:hypothetical protein
MDGIAFLEYIAGSGHNAFDGIAAPPADEPKLNLLSVTLDKWFSSWILQPSKGNEAWLPERLEYQFGCSASVDSKEVVMQAEEYYQGSLDWYALEHQIQQQNLGEPSPAPKTPERQVFTFIPAAIVFDGMPNTRWWAFEDRRTNFGDIRPDTTDLGKLLLIEFGLVYANDWFVLPYTLPIRTVAEVKGIALTNVFDERFWIEPVAEQPAENWERWSMFSLTPVVRDHQTSSQPESPSAARLVLLPTVSKVLESSPVEEVALIRDEMANMVWGIEKRIPLPSGVSKPGAEAAREFLQFLQNLIGAPAAPTIEPKAPIRYKAMNTVPENWIPFIPVHVDNNVREIQLQRAALPRILKGDPNPPEKIRPRTQLLRHGIPKAYFVHEEEVPRAGALVQQSYHRTRWIDGRAVTWLGVRKQTGRGEGSSGLKFDSLTDTEK